jgi:hypothetical protein
VAAIAIQHVTVLLVAVELQAVAAVGLGQRGKQALCEDSVQTSRKWRHALHSASELKRAELKVGFDFKI